MPQLKTCNPAMAKEIWRPIHTPSPWMLPLGKMRRTVHLYDSIRQSVRMPMKCR
jgi:hypothetical protein